LGDDDLKNTFHLSLFTSKQWQYRSLDDVFIGLISPKRIWFDQSDCFIDLQRQRLIATKVIEQRTFCWRIQREWGGCRRSPLYLLGKLRDFEVTESGTISDASVIAPIINADLFELDDYDTVEGLILTIECCQPLQFAMQELAWQKKVELSEDGSASALLTALQDEDFGWKEWIRLEGENGIDWFSAYIDETWLQQKVNWGYVDYFPKHYSGMAVAKQFFESLDGKVLDALGVEIIEGEHPGSSYFAAELRQDVEYANQVAREMGLGYRFRSA